MVEVVEEKKEELVIKEHLALVSIMRLIIREPTVVDVLDVVEMNELIVSIKEDVIVVREDAVIANVVQPVVEQFTIVSLVELVVKVAMVD